MKSLTNLFRKQHNWELVSKTYASPRRDLKIDKAMATESATLEKILLGVTTLVWECQITGDVRKEEFLGSDESQLDSLFQKVNELGTQHIKDQEGQVYSLAKWVPPVQDILDLPMR